MRKKKYIFLLFSLCCGTAALSLSIALIHDVYVFPAVLFHSFLTQEAIVTVLLFLFLLFLLVFVFSLINNKYLLVFLVVTGFTGSLLFCLAFALSINNNETIFFSSPDNQYRFAIMEKDVLHHTRHDIYQIHNYLYAVQIASVPTNRLEDSFSRKGYDIRWLETNQFTIQLSPGETKQEITIN